MSSATVTLAIAAFLSGAVTAVFVMLVAGIRAGDRRRLTAPPRSRLDALTRTCSASASAPASCPAAVTAERPDAHNQDRFSARQQPVPQIQPQHFPVPQAIRLSSQKGMAAPWQESCAGHPRGLAITPEVNPMTPCIPLSPAGSAALSVAGDPRRR